MLSSTDLMKRLYQVLDRPWRSTVPDAVRMVLVRGYEDLLEAGIAMQHQLCPVSLYVRETGVLALAIEGPLYIVDLQPDATHGTCCYTKIKLVHTARDAYYRQIATGSLRDMITHPW